MSFWKKHKKKTENTEEVDNRTFDEVLNIREDFEKVEKKVRVSISYETKYGEFKVHHKEFESYIENPKMLDEPMSKYTDPYWSYLFVNYPKIRNARYASIACVRGIFKRGYFEFEEVLSLDGEHPLVAKHQVPVHRIVETEIVTLKEN